MKRSRDTIQPKPLLEALAELQFSDGRIKAAAHNFLKTDLSRLRTDDEFLRAYNGLAACQQLLGPLHTNYARCLDGLRKVLDSFCKAQSQLLPGEWLDQMERLWAAHQDILREYCPAEVVTALGRMTDEYFRQMRGKDA